MEQKLMITQKLMRKRILGILKQHKIGHMKYKATSIYKKDERQGELKFNDCETKKIVTVSETKKKSSPAN